MKYLNKKKIERTGWTTVNPPIRVLMATAKKWCQQHPSNKRFYFHYTNTRWWFEDKDDALHFTLMWSK